MQVCPLRYLVPVWEVLGGPWDRFGLMQCDRCEDGTVTEVNSSLLALQQLVGGDAACGGLSKPSRWDYSRLRVASSTTRDVATLESTSRDVSQFDCLSAWQTSLSPEIGRWHLF
jgi:hypothetical protein